MPKNRFDKTLVEEIHSCADCLFLSDAGDSEKCYSCKWNPQTQLDDNWEAIPTG